MSTFLLNVRAKAAAFAGRPATDFKLVHITQYAPGVAVGWHRDRLHYGQIVGVSLRSPARFRLRRCRGDRWLRVALTLEPRSGYIMDGDVRHAWEHSIPPAETLRFSLTFRTLADR